MSLNKEYAEMVQEQKQKFRMIHPLLSGQEFSDGLHKKSRCNFEYQFLEEKAREKSWKNIPRLLEPLHNPDTAIIVTDARQNIEWVNQGFFKMTGYLLEEVAGRNPKMLQGIKTSKEDVCKIRKGLDKLQPFSGEIINYRKNGKPYVCKVNIFPLFNDQEVLVNFLAIENEIRLEPVNL